MKPTSFRCLRAVSLDTQKPLVRLRGVLAFSIFAFLLGGTASDGIAAEGGGAIPARVKGVWQSEGAGGRFEGSASAVRFEREIFSEAAAAGGLAAVPDASEGAPVFLGCTSASLEGGDLELCVPHRSLEFHILKRERSLVQSLADLRNKQIVVIEGSAVIPFLTEIGFEGQLLRVPTIKGVAGLLVAGKREVAVVDRFALYAEHAEGELEGLALLPEPVHSVSCGFAVEAGDEKLRLALEKGLGTIRRDGRYERITNEHLVQSGAGEERGLVATLRRYVGWLIIPLAILLLASCMVALALRQRAMEKILSLQEQVMEEKIRLARVRDDSAKQRFVLNQLSTVSLVDQLLESSGSRGDKTTAG